MIRDNKIRKLSILLILVVALVLLEGVFIFWNASLKVDRQPALVRAASASVVDRLIIVKEPMTYVINSDRKISDKMKRTFEEMIDAAEKARIKACWFYSCKVTPSIIVINPYKRNPGSLQSSFTEYNIPLTRDSAGRAQFKMNIYARNDYELMTTVMHEMAHVVAAGALVGQRGIPIPRFLDEPISLLIENPKELINFACKHDTKPNLLYSIRQLLEMKEYPKDRDLVLKFYSDSAKLLAFLMTEKGGRVNLLNLLNRVANGENIITAFSAVYKLTPEQMNSQWRAWLKKSKLCSSPDLMIKKLDEIMNPKNTVCKNLGSIVKPPRSPKVAAIYLYIVDDIPDDPAYRQYRQKIEELIKNSREFIKWMDNNAPANWRNFVEIVNQRPIWDYLENTIITDRLVVNGHGEFLENNSLLLLLQNTAR